MSSPAGLLSLLHIVIDSYITKGEPIGSKYLFALEDNTYAPSTLRKHLNTLEQEGLVYQPYKSSGRIPTVQGLSSYIDALLGQDGQVDEEFVLDDIDVELARSSLQAITQKIGTMADGVVVGFLSNDTYHYVGVNNILNEKSHEEFDTTKYIIDFIERRELVDALDNMMIKKGQIYYTFVHHAENTACVLGALYTRLTINGYDAIISIVGPSRVNYKKNLAILRKLASMVR